MNTKAIGSKKDRRCYNCRYWQGHMRVKSLNFVEFDRAEEATCNQTGFQKKSSMTCNNFEKRLDI